MNSLQERADERNKVLLVETLSEISKHENLLKVANDNLALIQTQLKCTHTFQSKGKNINPTFIWYQCSKCGCFIFGSDEIKEL